MGTANCTYNNPCGPNQFNQININAIDVIAKNANFYLNSGSGSYPLHGQLNVNNGQNIFGRSIDYVKAETDNARPSLQGSLLLQGNNRLDSLQLFNDASMQANGIQANNANNLILNNINIGALDKQQGYSTAVNLKQVNNVTLNNSTLNAYVEGGNTLAQGINLDQSSLTVTKTQINASATGITRAEAAGIFANSNINTNNAIYISTSTIAANATSQMGVAESVAIAANNIKTLTILNSKLQSNAFGNARTEAAGIFANSDVGNSIVQVSASTIAVNATSLTNVAESVDIAVTNIAALNAFANNLQSKATGRDVTESIGILVGGNANRTTINIAHNAIVVNATSTHDIARTAGLLAAAVNGNMNSNKIIIKTTGAELAEAFGIVTKDGNSTIGVNHNEINLLAYSALNNATAFAFTALNDGDSIKASNNFGSLQATAPVGIAIAQPVDPSSLGNTLEINDRFIF